MKVSGISRLAVIAAGIMAASAQAQTAANAPPATQAPNVSSSAQSDEIVVTAERRAQNLLSVPTSIQAETGIQLRNTGIKDLTSLSFTTPGFITQTNSGFTEIYIRGVGNSIFLGADPSVATFVDDVPRIYGSTNDQFNDVERVEVLKGAQGGLYGRNATGGVVNVITRQPSTDKFTADAVFSYGEKNTFRSAAYFNVPLGNHVAFSVDGERDTHDAYVKNLAVSNPYSAANFPNGAPLFGLNPQQAAAFFNSATAHPDLQNQNFYAIDAKLLIKGNNLKLLIAGDYSNKNDNTGSDQADTTPAVTQAALVGYFAALGIATNLPPGFVKGVGGKFTATAGFPEATPIRDYGVSGTATWNAPGFDLVSITAYRHQHTLFLSDVNSSSVPTALLDVEFNKHFFYQELRALSTFSGPLKLIGGATYLQNTQVGGNHIALLNPVIPAGSTQADDTVKNWSIYGQAEYSFTDALSLTVSGRYQHETNHVLFTEPVVSSGDATPEHKFVPSATLSYALDDGTAYVRWAKGFKNGGINLATAPAFFPRPQDGSVFAPETVDTYEAGFKKGLFNRRVQVTAAVFYNDYKNLQVDAINNPAFPAITTAIVNAKSARTYGAEGSLSWRVIDPLTLSINGGYLNARYKNFSLTGSEVLENFDQSGQQMPKAPKFQGSFNADLKQPINQSLNLVSNVLVSHTSAYFFETSGIPGVLPAANQPGYWLVNARIGLRTADDRYGVALVADNLFNQGYFTFGQSATTGVTEGWGDPRIIRVEFTGKF